MFFMKLAEKTGFLNVLAPRKSPSEDAVNTEAQGADTQKAGNDQAVGNASVQPNDEVNENVEVDIDTLQRQKVEEERSSSEPDASDAEVEDDGRREERQRQRMLEGQKKREEDARTLSQFVKNQRVRYYHKLSDAWVEEVRVAGVHHDDGADRPYYTIQFCRDAEDGSPQEKVEKQTTSDRLEAAEWDEDKSWAILSASKR